MQPPLDVLDNSIGMRFVRISAGEFAMGADDGGLDDSPVHRVQISNHYLLGVTTVTLAQWKIVMGTMPSSKRKADSRPVTQVCWDDAVEFCNELSKLPQEHLAGHVYRLPTEAEWEYACRAGSTTKFAFGDDETQLSDYAWYEGNSGGRERPVALKKPNAWGLFDMHGNVWEWCSDWYGPYTAAPTTYPQGPTSGSDRVYRGGSWGNGPAFCRSAFRMGGPPWIGGFNLGFRVAMSTLTTSAEEAAT